MMTQANVKQKGMGLGVMPEHAAVSELSYKNRYIILGIVLLGIFMSVLDGNVIGIAMPTITRAFSVDLSLSQWAATAYLLTITGTLLIFGKLSEYTGKAKMYIAGCAIFTIGSLACGLAPGIYELIGFRVLQAIGGSMLSSIGIAILFLAFPPAERGRAMGGTGAVMGIGSIIGPVLGGFMVDNFGWGSVFLVNVPIGIIVTLAALRLLKLDEATADAPNLDWIGGLTLIVTASSLMLFLGEIGQKATSLTIVYLAVFVLGLIAFIVQERRSKAPLIDLSIFKETRFALPLIGMLASFITTMLVTIADPFYFQYALHYAPSVVGLILFVPPAIMIVGAPASGWLVDKYPWKYYSTAGIAIMALSFAMIGYFMQRMDMTMILLSLAVYGIGESLFISPNNAEVMSALPGRKASFASSTSATVRNLGMGLGASMGAIIMTLQLATAGGIVAVSSATPSQIAGAVSLAMYLAAVICVLGTIALWMRYIGSKQKHAA